jgi:hypothetical protein
MHDAFLTVKNRYADNYILMSATEFLLDLQLIPFFDAYIIIDGKAYHKDYIKEALKLKESKSNNGIYFDKVIIRGNPINNTK